MKKLRKVLLTVFALSICLIPMTAFAATTGLGTYAKSVASNGTIFSKTVPTKTVRVTNYLTSCCASGVSGVRVFRNITMSCNNRTQTFSSVTSASTQRLQSISATPAGKVVTIKGAGGTAYYAGSVQSNT